MMNRIYIVALLCLLAIGNYFHVAHAQTVADCGSLENHYGPFDYTNPIHFSTKLPVVEAYHFNSNVESLRSAAVSGNSLIGDLDYTLRAFPNHHRALYAVMRYRQKHPARPGSQYLSSECYFKRALTFKSDDGIVWMLYGIFKHKKKQYDEALKNYKNAEKLLKDSAELYYNMGLLYYDMGKMELARKYAKKAYKLGYPLPALANKLKLKS